MKVWFGYSEDDKSRQPDTTIIEHFYSTEELTQAFADTVEVFNGALADALEEMPDGQELEGV